MSGPSVVSIQSHKERTTVRCGEECELEESIFPAVGVTKHVASNLEFGRSNRTANLTWGLRHPFIPGNQFSSMRSEW